MSTLEDAPRDEPRSDNAPAGVQHSTLAAELRLQHRFLDELPELCMQWQPDPVSDPELVVLNEPLVEQLGLDAELLAGPEATDVFAGNRVPEGAEPVALGYAGHQFGNYSPRLGDGRALLLGEIDVDASGAGSTEDRVTGDGDGELVDLHLKGSGRTPFARGGDGRATIGPMLREYVVAEALHSLGVPTTRSLAVVTTGEEVLRTRVEPGAVLTRVAASHVRVGTFEYAARLGGDDLVRRLADHVIARHHPHATDAENPYRGLLESVVEAQASLVAQWMLLGFIHGVMNTDNVTISGEGIDYGPCAFMDRYDPTTVFSSIDHGGRYAYGNQPRVAAWNLARLAETLLGLIADESEEAVAAATDLVNGFAERFENHLRAGMIAKLGLHEAPIGDETLFDDLLGVMQADGLDWTLTFRRLAAGLAGAPSGATVPGATVPGAGNPGGVAGGSMIEARSDALIEWTRRWREQLDREGREPRAVAEGMDRRNPLYIPRNHLLHEALEAATGGDLDPFRELTEVLSDPFTERPGLARFAEPAPDEFTTGFLTFCGT